MINSQKDASNIAQYLLLKILKTPLANKPLKNLSTIISRKIQYAFILGELSAIDRIFTFVKENPDLIQDNLDIRALLHNSAFEYLNILKKEFKEEDINLSHNELIKKYELN